MLFAVVFFWTPPHFWALAMRYREDYARAGVPMLPVVASPTRVAREIVVLHLADGRRLAGLWPLATGWVYGVLGRRRRVRCSSAAHRLLHATRRGGSAKSMQLFHLSNSYLAFVFVAVADRVTFTAI